jgi:hypothetical protein
MASTKSRRLTQDMRLEILQSAVTKTFEERKVALRVRQNTIANKVLDYEIGAENLVKMKALPNEFFQITGSVAVLHNSDMRAVRLPMTEARRVPAYLNYGTITLDKNNGMWKEINAVNVESSSIDDGKRELEETLVKFLAGFTLVSKLIEAWPEAESHLPDEEDKKHLPSLRAEDLNSMIGKFSKV